MRIIGAVMSRRGRVRRVDRTRTPPPANPDPAPGAALAEARVPAYALLPLRFFFGITFPYAGLDKLIDPSFFDASAPTSIVAQMAAFARDSPLSPLIKVVEPAAVLQGPARQPLVSLPIVVDAASGTIYLKA